MRKLMLRLLAVPLAAVSVGSMALADAVHVAHWQHYGADHAYASKSAAKADAGNVMRRAGWSPEAVQAMLKKMQEKPERITLKKGDRVDWMRSGKAALWHNVLVDFIAPPGKGINVTADADYWSVSVGGVVYEIFLPDVCNNLAGRTSRTPGSPCRIVNVTTKDVREVALHYRYESDDDCWGYREAAYVGQPEGEGNAFVKPGPCPEGPCNFIAVDSVAPMRMDLIGTIPVSPGVHQYRVSKKFLDNCIEFLDQGNRDSSFTTRVRPFMDYRMLKGQMQAIVYYSSADIPKGVKLDGPFGLFSWATSQAEADRINGKFTLANR